MKNALAFAGVLALATLVAGARSRTGGAHRSLNLAGRADDRPYSHAVLAGDTLYVAGTIGVDPETGEAPDDVEREVRLCMDELRAKLALADMGMDDVVQVQVFCTDLSLYGTFNAVYRTYFGEHFPARTFVGSGPLLAKGRFEVNAIAERRR